MTRRRALLARVGSEPVDPTPTGYVTDGLLLWLDAIYNTRNGHNAGSLYWEDLSGNLRDYAIGNSGAVFQSSSVLLPTATERPCLRTSKPFTADEQRAITSNISTIELVMSPIIDNGYNIIYAQGNTYGTINLYGNKLSFRPRDKNFSVDMLNGLHGYNSELWVDGIKQTNANFTTSWNYVLPDRLFSYNNQNYPYCGEISSIRIYNRRLTDAELMQNWLRDKARYNL